MRRTEGKLQELSTLAMDATARWRAEEIRGRVASMLCASVCPLKKTSPTGGTEAAATQSSGKGQGDVVH